MIIVEIVDPLVQLGILRTLFDRCREEIDVRVERELVHWIDEAHIVEDEEEYGSALRARPIGFPGDIDLPLGFLGYREGFLDRYRGRLGSLQSIEQIQIIEKRTGRDAQ